MYTLEIDYNSDDSPTSSMADSDFASSGEGIDTMASDLAVRNPQLNPQNLVAQSATSLICYV